MRGVHETSNCNFKRKCPELNLYFTDFVKVLDLT